MKAKIQQRVRVCGPKDQNLIPDRENAVILNVTSTSATTLGKCFSPFFLGPVELYDGIKAENVENAWQFCKVYEQYADEEGEPLPEYWEWAENGWADKFAQRYPMGRNAKPLYSLWNDERLDYIEARKQIYIPIYAQSVLETGLLDKLEAWVIRQEDLGKTVYLFDFDGYDNVRLGLTLDDVLENPKRKMGHAFVLAMQEVSNG